MVPSLPQILRSDLAGRHSVIVCAGPTTVSLAMSYFRSCQRAATAPTSMCLVAPDWPAVTRLMRAHDRLPVALGPADITGLCASAGPVPSAFAAWHVPPQPALVAAMASNAGEQLVCTVRVAGSKTKAVFDSGATHCFTDRATQQARGLSLKPTRVRAAKIADGSTCHVYGECSTEIRVPGVHAPMPITFLVVDRLPTSMGNIIGMNWMSSNGVVLDTGERTITIRGRRDAKGPAGPGGQSSPPYPTIRVPEPSAPAVDAALDLMSEAPSVPLMSDKQVRRALRKGCEAWLGVVREDTTMPVLNLAAGVATDAVSVSDGACPAADAGAPAGGTRLVPEETMAALLDRFKAAFEPPPPGVVPPNRGSGDTVPLVPGATPVYRRGRRMSPAELAEAKRQVSELLAKGYIEPSKSPWGAPVLFVGKKDGTLRMAIDYRGLNAVTVKNRYPVPRVDELLDRLSKATVFSSLDLQSAYHQVGISGEDVPKTAFTTPFGHYQFKVLSFGLTNAPATFQKVMNDLFAPYSDFVVVYLDDILVFSATPEEHVRHLETVLSTLLENKLFAKLSKCHFNQGEVTFLGHIVGSGTVRADPAKVRAVMDWPTPRTLKELQRFLGLANYFRRFIHHYSSRAAPLTRLAKPATGKGALPWGEQQELAFKDLKHALCSAPVLALPDFEQPFVVWCDASIVGTGAVLMQNDRPVAYYSHKLTSPETRYITTEQEQLAVVKALGEWKCYLEGPQFTLVTDHHPTTHLPTQPDLSRRQARWIEKLSRYRFNFKYWPGKENIADGLSRVHCFDTPPAVIPERDPVPAMLMALAASAAPSPLLEAVASASPPGRRWRRKDDIMGAAITKKGQLWYTADDQVVVPDEGDLRVRIMRECHDSPLAAHMGKEKTYDLVTRQFWWPTVRKDVTRYVRECHSCQAVKVVQQRPGGLLQPLPVPELPWDVISMDFIVSLPRTPRGYDSVLVVVDKLTKMAHFIPTTTKASASDAAGLVLSNVVKLHGVPLAILSDRDPKFVSKFWQCLWENMGAESRMSSSYHPQTDGQTERVNRVLEDMLRHFVAPEQTNWDVLLPCAEFAYNNAKHVSSGSTPFFLNYGFHPRGPGRIDNRSNPRAVAVQEDIERARARARECLEAARQRQKSYADQRRRDVTFTPGQRVMFDSRNLRHADPSLSKKLMPRWIGPFPVEGMVGGAAVRLRLPEGYLFHPVVHVSLVKPYHARQVPGADAAAAGPPPIDYLPSGEPVWRVERILDHEDRLEGRSRKRRVRYYLIKWEGYPPDQNSWEPAENLLTCDKDIAAYERGVAARGAAGDGAARGRPRPRV